MRRLVLALSLLVALGACQGKEKAAATGEPTETIAPAQPQPEATGTDAMTQTVDIEDSRTEGEGAALNETAADTATTAATTTTTTTTANTTTR